MLTVDMLAVDALTVDALARHLATRTRYLVITILTIGATIVAVAAPPAAAPALADGGTGGVINDGDGVSVEAGTGARRGGSGGGGGSAGGTEQGTCVYQPASPSPETIAALGGQPSGQGAWYLRTCYTDRNGVEEGFGTLVWIPGAAPVTSPQALARYARSKLRLPAVTMHLNPAGTQLVNLPTWLALDASSWQPQSATASVPGVSVTATARPVRAAWSMGDGGAVTCASPGTAWTSGTDPAASSPDCGYTYRHSSAGAPGAAFPVTVTVTWEVTWAGAGRSGTIAGLHTTGTAQARVQESQGLLTS